MCSTTIARPFRSRSRSYESVFLTSQELSFRDSARERQRPSATRHLLLKVHSHRRRRAACSGEDGYVLLVMLLFFALLAVTLTAVVPAMMQKIRREREIELIHRGKQYARAIQLYYRKFGSYPVTLESLENTNNIRFLRKRYKDPMTPNGQWRLIHYGEATLTTPGAGPLMPGATTPGGSPLGGAPGTGASLGVAGAGASSAFASTFSLSSQGQGTSGTSTAQSSNVLVQAGATPGQSGTTQTTSTESSSSQTSQSGSQSSQSGQTSQSAGEAGQPGTPVSQLSSAIGTGQVLGGGPIVGVASLSKKESIKELNKKHHYNEWEFVYDPTLDLMMAGALGAAGIGQPNPQALGTLGLGPQAPGAFGSSPQAPGTQSTSPFSNTFGSSTSPGMQPTTPTH
jgi:type II secretory pathway pseudopilin PulG